ncbi:MAG: hypothetical protein ABI333_01965 [bacterium]
MSSWSAATGAGRLFVPIVAGQPGRGDEPLTVTQELQVEVSP